MRRQRERTPRFATAATLLFAAGLLIAACAPARAAESWSNWYASRVVERGGYPVFTVNGRPFFVYGAAFFYERTPRPQWRDALLSYRRIGINTIDLYVIWNWHEPADGSYDFDGHTNPRRDLIGALQLCRELGFKVVLRPGPVIRNEWRNGGYPDWLLERPEYGMPLHDVLEGRYPATATLQNAHADAAAAEWLANGTHLSYASAWLRRVLTTVAPFSHDVIAIALDDDQGAYIDNDTWPAPHWHDYVGWLAAEVRETTGRRVPLFINTYETKVAAAAPAWAWGDWYQSDAFSIGEHDRAQLGFSTGLLQTQPALPTMMAEFQAGWLQGAGEATPRPADPSNTELALHELLSLGTHGVINFPAQDTVYPSGWEAPWANWSYAWDAAYRLDGTNARYAPTARFGAIVSRFGDELASTHVAAQAAIVWPASLYDPFQLTNRDVAAMQAATMSAQQACRNRNLACDTIDLRFASPAVVARYPQIVLPPPDLPDAANLTPAAQNTIARLSARHILVDSVERVDAASPIAGVPGAVLLLGDTRSDPSFANVTNWSDAEIRARNVRVALPGRAIAKIATLDVAPRSAAIVRLNATGPSRQADPPVPPPPSPAQGDGDSFAFATGIWSVQEPPHHAGDALAFAQDFLHDGSDQIVMQNDRIRIIFSPNAGARAFVLQARAITSGGVQSWGPNLASPAGLLRDDVGTPAPPSARDYIAAYTHPFPAGTFNRPYSCYILASAGREASVQCYYDAPDLPA
ncbi:MAG: beta-galactosidase, partial [Vulcanimicrobiaceae bacterium]